MDKNVDDVSSTSSNSQEDNEPAESTDNSLLSLEQRVKETCALVERILREREEREQVRREIERKRQEIREQIERKRGAREAMEQEEASWWPQQQEAITGCSQWLCEHYQRHCRVRFPCCSYFYSCHRCHNNSKACKNEEAKACHATHLKCSFCQHEQEIGEDSRKCRSCGAQMSAYFCPICKHFTSVDKNPYHCEKCGVCRDKSFHCEVCNVCLDKCLEGKHECRPDSGHDECCICLEEGSQTSASPEHILLVTMEEKVTEACTVGDRCLKKQQEQTKRQSELVQRQGEIREQRIREARDREREIREKAQREAREREDMAVAVLAPVEESPLWQCEHFQRRCNVMFPCCGVFYPCHRCHNGSGACDSRNKKANQAIHIKCSNCGHKEEINEGSQTCSSCGTRMSEYFCFKCKHFTGVDKNPFHCDKCGICRIHRERAFHCDVCNVCLDKRLEGKHKCQPKHAGHKSKGKKRGSVTYSTDRENKENQGQEGDMLEDQCALQTERIVDAVPGDGDGVDNDNESNPESESTCSEEDLSAISNNAVLNLKAIAAPRSREQIVHLENTVQELKKENQTLEALLKIAISRGDIPDLPGMNAVCDDSSTRLSLPAYRHYNTGVATNVPLEPSLVDVVQGIDAGFLARHTQDPHLCESPQANVENTSLPEAEPNVASSLEDPVSRQWIRNPRLVPSENDCVCCENDGGQASRVCGTIIPERCRPDSGHVCYECSEVSSSEDPVSRQWIRNPCLVPSENDCVCCENDGGQACTERCRPDSGHDVCCVCLEDVFNGLQFLPCPHHIHMDCLIDMIRNGALNCPLCSRPFLRRG